MQAAVDAKNEVEVLRRQNTVRLKELNKELATTKVIFFFVTPHKVLYLFVSVRIFICPHILNVFLHLQY